MDSLNRGGAEILALDVCRNARAGGLDLSFVATGGGALEDDFKRSGVDFHRLERRLPLDFGVVAALRRIVKERSVEIVHAHQAVEGMHAYFACLGTRARLVLSFHGYIADRKNRLALRFLIPRTAANVTVSREFLTWLKEKENLATERNFHVVYNGVDERRLASSGNDLKKELGLGPDALVFGMIGNFYAAPRKDQLTVCHALPAVFARLENAHFVFAGAAEAGSDYEECLRVCRANGIENRVHFLGARSDVADILAALDVFVLSTRHESFGIAAVEAMLAGAPAVLSDIEPLREVACDGEFAEIFRTGDAADLAAKLIGLGEDHARREALADRARRHARANFSIEAHIANLKKLYAEIAG